VKCEECKEIFLFLKILDRTFYEMYNSKKDRNNFISISGIERR